MPIRLQGIAIDVMRRAVLRIGIRAFEARDGFFLEGGGAEHDVGGVGVAVVGVGEGGVRAGAFGVGGLHEEVAEEVGAVVVPEEGFGADDGAEDVLHARAVAGVEIVGEDGGVGVDVLVRVLGQEDGVREGGFDLVELVGGGVGGGEVVSGVWLCALGKEGAGAESSVCILQGVRGGWKGKGGGKCQEGEEFIHCEDCMMLSAYD